MCSLILGSEMNGGRWVWWHKNTPSCLSSPKPLRSGAMIPCTTHFRKSVSISAAGQLKHAPLPEQPEAIEI